MLKSDAERRVLKEWHRWKARNIAAGQKPAGSDGFLFYGHLLRLHTDLMDFRDKGDKWQTVHGWLLRHQEVRD